MRSCPYGLATTARGGDARSRALVRVQRDERGVPADRVKIMRDAFAAMTKDEQFIKESEKMGLEISLIRGEEMNRDIEATMRDKRLMDMYKQITTVK